MPWIRETLRSVSKVAFASKMVKMLHCVIYMKSCFTEKIEVDSFGCLLLNSVKLFGSFVGRQFVSQAVSARQGSLA